MTAGVKVSGAGDAQKLRKALRSAGFPRAAKDHSIFSDTRKNSRRLKVWFANSIFYAPQVQQQYLEEHLMKEFGKRYVGGFFIQCSAWGIHISWDSSNPPAKSFCVRLKK